MSRYWIHIALINFLVAACLGATLRWMFVAEVSWLDYKNVQHAHSHLAMLGWIYLVLYYFIWKHFITPSQQVNSKYSRLFWFTQITLVGMTISFVLQGYGLISITFASLNIITHYLFFGLTRRDLAGSGSASGLLLRTAFIWCVLSTLGVWMLGPIMMGVGKGTSLYYMSIQFYLHFQFNGWFTFAIMALFFKYLEDKGMIIPQQHFRLFYRLLVSATILTYALSITWSTPISALFYVNSVGVILQLAALFYLLRIIKNTGTNWFANLPADVKMLLMMSLISFILKIVIQGLVVLPQVAIISYTIRQFVIGFIHLTLLGSISMYLVAFILKENAPDPRNQWPSWIFISGFILSEMVLFAQGLMLWLEFGFMPFYYQLIFGVSLLLPLGILLIMNMLKRSRPTVSLAIT